MREIRAGSSPLRQMPQLPSTTKSLYWLVIAVWLFCLGAATSPKEVFSDVTETAGITWKQFSGESPDRFMIEAAGGGVAFFDYDGDGLLGLFLVNGGGTP